MTDTRHRILHLLKRCESGMTLEQLSDSLQITAMAVHRPLTVLEAQGLVQSDVVKKSRGRPVHVFRLTEAAETFFPKNYTTLLLDLLSELSLKEGVQGIRRLFHLRFKKFVERHNGKIQKKDFPSRVEAASQILDENGYMTQLEQIDSRKFHLKLHNCPISLVAKEFPEVCSCEHRSLSQLTQAKVKRDHHVLNGQNYCSYIVEKK